MEKLTLVIGNKNYSSWSLRAWLALKGFKIPFKEILIPLGQEDSKKEIFEYSPSGKVPVLIDGKTIIWESIAICEYAADLFPKMNLWPKDKKAKAWARSVSAEMHASFIHLRKNYPMNVKARIYDKPQPEEVKQDIVRITSIWEECRQAFKKKGHYLFGDFTIADCMFAPIVFRFQSYGINVTGLAKDYCDTMIKFPAMVEWAKAATNEPYVIPNH